ncbi:MAG TPA: HEAT repeat domain-containing protein [Bryobacteraceae bacterium]|nr:HEAT repeat domain-containing protein [Bryobacteraceae bacterium]
MAACVLSAAWGQSADADALRAQMDAARAQAEAARKSATDMSEQLRRQIKEATAGQTLEMTKRMTEDAMRIAEDQIAFGLGDQLAQVRMSLELAQDIAPKPATAPMAPMAPMPPMPARPMKFRLDNGSYESGKSALDNHNYERAVEIFNRVIDSRDSKNSSSRADGAYYWKAYALNKLGKRDEALAALAELAKQFPQSSWLNDAKALQAEVQQAKGPVSPENQADEDLRLYAINALMNSDAERAVPLLEGLLNNPKMSPRLKERALFVLAQSRTDKAHEIVGRYAKGASNPDLQLTAVQYLGTFRSTESRQLLGDVYKSTTDVNVKRAVLRSFEMSRDTEHLMGIAKSEQNVELRREAVRQLGNIRDDQTVASLVSVYGSESDKDIKSEILNSLGNQGAVKQLIECARKESDPELKRAAVRRLSQMKSKEALDFMAELLK